MDEEEVDIEGEFDLHFQAEHFGSYDVNELPSKTANLHPEFTQPPWMLEQGWSLDHCADEKSKAAIEKMLQEEQQYLGGKTTHKSPTKPTSPKSTYKKPWGTEEKDLFEKGLEIYGRSWTKIAELIPNRSSLQVKNYAQQHFKNKAKSQASTLTSSIPAFISNPPTSLDDALNAMATGQPTVKMTSKGKRNGKMNAESPRKRQKVLKPKRSHSDSSAQDFNFSNQELVINGLDIKSQNNFLLSSEGEVTKVTKDEDDEEVDVEIDVEDEEEMLGDVLVQRASAGSVYETLVKSANIFSPDVKHAEETVFEENPNVLKSAEETKLIHALDTNLNQEHGLKDTENENDELTSSGQNIVQGEVPVAELITKVNEVNNTESLVYLENGTLENHDQILDLNSEGLDLLTTTPFASDVNVDKTALDSQQTYNVETGTESGDTQLSNTEEQQWKNKNEYEILTSSNKVVLLPKPTEETSVDRESITDEEKLIHAEFFDGRPLKTPKRYITIRNYILDAWQKCKPSYLYKTSVRPGLKNCGDVNCIGRVHSFLELKGAINYGCDEACYNRPPKKVFPPIKTKQNKEVLEALQAAKMDAMRPRKRRVRDAFGNWINEDEQEGMTIEHSDESHLPNASKPKAPKTRYDPFKLVPCLPFSEEKQPPFAVQLHSCALVMMDVHSHMSKTEVIGLLGGVYYREERVLKIMMAEPCNSLSTGMQCEMDPVSQTQASELIISEGYSVVGWYHSHPTFAPRPSVRDIETQEKFQTWFAKGGIPFIGVIVSPYNGGSTSIHSEVTCLTVSSECSQGTGGNVYKLPYQFAFNILLDIPSYNHHFMTTLNQLVNKCASCSSRVEMTLQFKSTSGLSCIDKMLESITNHLPQFGAEEFIDCLRNLFCEKFEITSTGFQSDINSDGKEVVN